MLWAQGAPPPGLATSTWLRAETLPVGGERRRSRPLTLLRVVGHAHLAAEDTEEAASSGLPVERRLEQMSAVAAPCGVIDRRVEVDTRRVLARLALRQVT